MSSPATDPVGGKSASPVRSKMMAGNFARALGVLFFIGNLTVLWPIFYLIGLVTGLVRARSLFFPFGFRARRKHFWTAILLYLCLGGLIVAIIYGAADDKDISRTTANVLAGGLGGAMMASLLSISVSRLHDRDLSGWWIFLYYGIPAAAIARLSLGNAANWEFAVLGGAINVFVIWAIFALGIQTGTIGPNRFGEESPWFRDTRRRRTHTAPPPLPQPPPAAQPAAGVASTAVARAPTPANPDIHAPAAVTQAPAIATQALAAAVVSPTAKAQLAPMSAPAAPMDIRVREIAGDLISVTGRMDSRSYWTCSAIQCAYALLAWLLIHIITGDRNISQRAYWVLVGATAFLPAAMSMTASTIRRLHDRDLSAWWLPGFLIIFVVCGEVFFLIFDHQFVAMDGSFIFAIWAVATYQFGRMPGTVGPNRFGPDPLD